MGIDEALGDVLMAKRIAVVEEAEKLHELKAAYFKFSPFEMIKAANSAMLSLPLSPIFPYYESRYNSSVYSCLVFSANELITDESKDSCMPP